MARRRLALRSPGSLDCATAIHAIAPMADTAAKATVRRRADRCRCALITGAQWQTIATLAIGAHHDRRTPVVESSHSSGVFDLAFRLDCGTLLGMTVEGRRPVLLVDDDSAIRESLAYLLETHGYQVETAMDGREALALLRAGVQPCLIVLDLAMPRTNGFEFREQQLQDPEFATIPVVVWSGVHDLHAMTISADALLHKPMDLRRLLQIAEAYADRQATT